MFPKIKTLPFPKCYSSTTRISGISKLYTILKDAIKVCLHKLYPMLCRFPSPRLCSSLYASIRRFDCNSTSSSFSSFSSFNLDDIRFGNKTYRYVTVLTIGKKTCPGYYCSTDLLTWPLHFLDL